MAGPRRNKMARMEAMINSKLDLQEQLSRRRDTVETEIRARLEANERVQEQRALVEEQISAKLDAEMQAFVGLQRQLLVQQAQATGGAAPFPPREEASLPLAEAAPLSKISVPSTAAAALLGSTASPRSTAASYLSLPLNLSLGVGGNSMVAGTNNGDLPTGESGQVPSLAGMSAQLSQASFQPSSSSDGSIALNIQITFSPANNPPGESGSSNGKQ